MEPQRTKQGGIGEVGLDEEVRLDAEVMIPSGAAKKSYSGYRIVLVVLD
jgi:hypothetical protein